MSERWDGRIKAHALQLPIADESVQMCVTSPPYWGLRAYKIPPAIFGGDPNCSHEWQDNGTRGGPGGKQGATSQRAGRSNVDEQVQQHLPLGESCECGAWRGQLGLEPTPYLYVDHMVEIFREVWRVLKKDGTLWLNLGDCYATGAGAVGNHPGGGAQGARWSGDVNRIRDDKRGYRGDRLANGRGDQDPEFRKTRQLRDGSHAGKHTAISAIGPMTQPNRMPIDGLKPKDLVGIPWRVALALQADGWWLRQDIIWNKPNPMPESVQDRLTRSHEYVFLLTKSEKYYYDAEAIMEAAVTAEEAVYDNGLNGHGGGVSHAGQGSSTRKFRGSGNKERKYRSERGGNPASKSNQAYGVPWEGAALRNKRDVWTINTQPYAEAHYATFPPELPTLCIKAGSRPGDIVLDNFFGSGTVGEVAKWLERKWIGIDLGYQDLQGRRVAQEVFPFSASDDHVENETSIMPPAAPVGSVPELLSFCSDDPSHS